MSLLNLPGSACGCGDIWGSLRPLPASVCGEDTTGTPSPACPGFVPVTGRGCLPQPGLPPRPGCVCVDWGQVSSAEEPLPRPGRPLLSLPVRARGDLPDSVAAAGGGRGRGGGGSKLPCSERKPRSCEAPNGEVKKSGRPPLPRLPPTLAAPRLAAPPAPSRPPEPSLPSRQQRPRWRRLDPASCKYPGAPRVAGGRAGRPGGRRGPPASVAPGPLQA